MPFITSEGAFGQNVCKLVSGVDIFEMDSRVQIHPVIKSIQRTSVGLGYMSHSWASALDSHLYDCSKLDSKAWLIT